VLEVTIRHERIVDIHAVADREILAGIDMTVLGENG
jgi:hypothetical protein